MKKLLILSILALAVMFILAACGGGPASEAPYDPAVTPLTGADLENVSSIKNAEGATPCGVFNVNGHGFKTADLRQFPNCKGTAYKVACLNDKAAWISDNVTVAKLVGDQVTFTSRQDGTCGLFAAP